jgi:hypothetical protein
MLRSNYKRSSGVILDECRQHGTWLDADELEQVAGFILAGGHTSPMLDAEHAAAEREAAVAFARASVERRAEESLFIGSRRRSLLDLFLDVLH